MVASARKFASYGEGLKIAFEEEISGETYFAAMAEKIGGRPAEALRLIAEIERETVRILAPSVERAGIAIRDVAALREEGRAEGLARAEAGWPEIVRMMAEDYDAYVDEFVHTLGACPESDRARLQILVDHEVAIIDFAQAWRADAPDPMAPLRAYLYRVSHV